MRITRITFKSLAHTFWPVLQQFAKGLTDIHICLYIYTVAYMFWQNPTIGTDKGVKHESEELQLVV